MSKSSGFNKSTNVRIKDLQRKALGALAAVAPDAMARYAAHRFFTPWKVERPGWEVELLGRATAFTFVGGGRLLPAWSWGEGPTVLLAHGWAGRGSQLGALVAPLVAAGMRVVTFDAPGHGDAPGAEVTVVEMSEVIAALVAELGAVHAVVAHSLGGYAARLAVARGGGAIERLVLVGSPSTAAAFPRAFPRMLGFGEEATRALLGRIEARLGSPLDVFDEGRFVYGEEVPLLVVHDRGDREVPFDNAERLAAQWRGARLVATEGLGHRRVLRDPDVVKEVVGFAKGPCGGACVASPLAGLERELYVRELRRVA